MGEEQRVTVSVSEGVADVRMNRPDKLNALDQAMFVAIAEAGSRLAADPSVRAVVLSGEGRGFCAGLDFEAFASMAGDGASTAGASTAGDRGGGVSRLRERPPGRIANLGQQAAYAWTEMPVPVIAAVHGVALGGGLQIALGADLRIVAPDARLSVLEIRWGLVPDMTGTHMLPRLLPLDRAKELVWTGRMVSGTEAVAMGLATKAEEEPREAALGLAREIAGRNPHAIRAAKRLLNQSGLVDQAQQFLDESAEMGALIGSPNQVEAVRAWFEKRDPNFGNPG